MSDHLWIWCLYRHCHCQRSLKKSFGHVSYVSTVVPPVCRGTVVRRDVQCRLIHMSQQLPSVRLRRLLQTSWLSGDDLSPKLVCTKDQPGAYKSRSNLEIWIYLYKQVFVCVWFLNCQLHNVLVYRLKIPIRLRQDIIAWTSTHF